MRFPLLAALTCVPTLATPCTTDAMLVFDGSGSMAELQFEVDAPARIEEARIAVARAMPEIELFRNVGLMTYGPGAEDACAGIVTHFPPIPNAAAPVVETIERMTPGGLTPLADAVEEAAKVLNWQSKPGVIVVVTDGNETCGGRPCALSSYLARTAKDLTIHVVGFRLSNEFFQWDNPEGEPGSSTVTRCMSRATGGMFVSTQTIDELTQALLDTLGCSLIGRGPWDVRVPTAFAG